MTRKIITIKNPVIRRTDFSIFNSLQSSDIFKDLDFIQVYTNNSDKMFLDKDLCSPIFYDGHRVEFINFRASNEESYGIEDVYNLGYHEDEQTFKSVSDINKSLISYQAQVESDYPDLVAVNTEGLNKKLWNPDPNFLYDFICAYREVRIPWKSTHKFLCYTTLEKATKVLVLNGLNKNSLIKKQRLF